MFCTGPEEPAAAAMGLVYNSSKSVTRYRRFRQKPIRFSEVPTTLPLLDPAAPCVPSLVDSVVLFAPPLVGSAYSFVAPAL